MPSVPTGSRVKAQVLTEGHLLWEPCTHCDSPCRSGAHGGDSVDGPQRTLEQSLPRPRRPGAAPGFRRAARPRLGLSCPLCSLCCPSPRRTPAAGRGGLCHLPVCSGGPALPGSLSTPAVGRAGPRCLLGLGVARALRGTRPPGQSLMTLGALRTGEERGWGAPARLGQKSLSVLPRADTPSAASERVFRRPTWVPSYPTRPLQAQPGPSLGGPCPCSGCPRWLSGSHPLLLRISTQPHPVPPLPCPAPLPTLLQPGPGL